MTDALKLLPAVPTLEMGEAGIKALSGNGVDNVDDSDAIVCYAAMFNAAPCRHVAVTDDMKLRAWRAATQACLNERGRYIAPVSAEEWDRALTAALTAALSGDADD